jgi:hypothetical protein
MSLLGFRWVREEFRDSTGNVTDVEWRQERDGAFVWSQGIHPDIEAAILASVLPDPRVTTQEPVGDPGLEWERRREFLAGDGPRVGFTAEGFNLTIPLSLEAHIEAQAIAPWREALRRLEDVIECSCRFGHTIDGDVLCDGHKTIRDLLHPNAEGGSNGS